MMRDHMYSTRVAGALLLGLLSWAHAVEAADFEVAFPALEFIRPLFLAAPLDGSDRLFVLEQRGVVSWFENRPDVPVVHEALDLSEKVRTNGNEEGLLGLAFHPAVAENRAVFLMYTASKPRRNVLSRFTMDEEIRNILPETEEVLLEVTQPYSNHNGGMLAFGPDGYLYVSLGDGGAAADPHGNAQNREKLLGKILRIDVNRADPGRPYAVPEDNPFVGVEKDRGEVWAYGLRNVWRFSFDRETGTMWGGDVGQWAWEEIDIIKKGKNYGWNLREGKHPFVNEKAGVPPPGTDPATFVEPVVDHNRKEARSITGGYVYRGLRHPDMRGAYVYADYVTGNVWILRYNGKELTEHRLLGEAPAPASFGEDRDGELYMTCFDGKIYSVFP